MKCTIIIARVIVTFSLILGIVGVSSTQQAISFSSDEELENGDFVRSECSEVASSADVDEEEEIGEGENPDLNRSSRGFDLILSSETCYTEKSCAEVARVIDDLLGTHRRALSLVASKRFYFGTGGSAACFRRECSALGLEVTVVEIIDNGMSNIREIMQVKRPH